MPCTRPSRRSSECRPSNCWARFLPPGIEPGLPRLKVAELYSPPRVMAELGRLPSCAALAPGSTLAPGQSPGEELGFPPG